MEMRGGASESSSSGNNISRNGSQSATQESLLQSATQELTSDIGAFEKHTRGVGSRILYRWGFKKGNGLGKFENGMRIPFHPIARPPRLALGNFFKVEKHASEAAAAAAEAYRKSQIELLKARKKALQEKTALGEGTEQMTKSSRIEVEKQYSVRRKTCLCLTRQGPFSGCP